jgi:hypothetical protein
MQKVGRWLHRSVVLRVVAIPPFYFMSFMNLKNILTIFALTATSVILTSCSEKPYHNGKEIRVISRRCDTSGCLDKVQYVEGHLPPFEVSPDRIEWR